MSRSGLLESIIISVASLTLAQNSIPTSTSSTPTIVAPPPASGVQLADASRTANVAGDSDALSTAVIGDAPIWPSIPILGERCFLKILSLRN